MKLEHKLLATLWLLGLTDTILTKLGLDTGGKEVNPLFYLMPDSFLLFKYVVVSAAVFFWALRGLTKKEVSFLRIVTFCYFFACVLALVQAFIYYF